MKKIIYVLFAICSLFPVYANAYTSTNSYIYTFDSVNVMFGIDNESYLGNILYFYIFNSDGNYVSQYPLYGSFDGSVTLPLYLFNSGYSWVATTNTGNFTQCTSGLSTCISESVNLDETPVVYDTFTYVISTCSDVRATNYSSEPYDVPSTSSCIFVGCTDPQALNYVSYANQNDGSCYYYAMYSSTATTTATSSIPVTVVRDYDLNFGQALQVFFDALIALGLLFPLRTNKRDYA